MASDLSNIIKSEIANTLHSLLSVEAEVTSTNKADTTNIAGQQCVCIEVNYEFSSFETTKWKFYIPTAIATKFEFLMLGGIGDLKESIDDEIADAINEIISNICGSLSTAFNAQGYGDLGTAKFTIESNNIIQCEDISDFNNIFEFQTNLDSEPFLLLLEFEDKFTQFVSLITTGVEGASDNSSTIPSEDGMTDTPVNSPILSLLGEDSIENLRLLFNVKLKLSVRLGTKIVLLKDILSWDTGSLIELEQMSNEPLDILVNGVKIGIGEAVIVEGKFGIKIKEIGTKSLI